MIRNANTAAGGARTQSTIRREVFVQTPRTFEKEIARLNKKAARVGLPSIRFENLGRTTRTRTTLITGGDGEGEVSERRIPVEVTRYALEIPAIELRGWETLARLTPIEGNGTFAEAIKPGFDPSPWKTADVNRCDHCNVNRRRIISYVVRNTDTDRVMQVGRKCFEDIIGKDTLEALEFTSVVMVNIGGDDEGFYPGGYGARAVEVVSVRRCVAFAEGLRAVDGWVNNSKDQFSGEILVEGTHRIAAYHATNRTRTLRGEITHTPEALAAVTAPENSVTSDEANPAWAAADTIINRMREIDAAADDEFANALKMVSEYELIPAQKAGLAAYIGQFLRNLDERTRQEAKKATMQFVGKVGERLTFELTCVRCPSFETDFGTTYVNTFEDGSGNVLIWKTGSANFNIGEKVTLKGTVKEHSEYKGAKQTLLSRCKVQETLAAVA